MGSPERNSLSAHVHKVTLRASYGRNEGRLSWAFGALRAETLLKGPLYSAPPPPGSSERINRTVL